MDDDYLESLDRLREISPDVADYHTFRRVVIALKKEFPLVFSASVHLRRKPFDTEDWAVCGFRGCWFPLKRGGRFKILVYRTGLAPFDTENLIHEWAHARVWPAEDDEFHCPTWAAEHGKLLRWYWKKFVEG